MEAVNFHRLHAQMKGLSNLARPFALADQLEHFWPLKTVRMACIIFRPPSCFMM